jgi:hypothetical protein
LRDHATTVSSFESCIAHLGTEFAEHTRAQQKIPFFLGAAVEDFLGQIDPEKRCSQSEPLFPLAFRARP